jgi:hypothetical protein
VSEHPDGVSEHPDAMSEHPDGVSEHPDAMSEHPDGISEHPDGAERQIELCRNATRSWIFIKKLKTVTIMLYATIGSVRVKMNALGGYVHLAGGTLDLAYADL